jgi:hypothetical protein
MSHLVRRNETGLDPRTRDQTRALKTFVIVWILGPKPFSPLMVKMRKTSTMQFRLGP